MTTLCARKEYFDSANVELPSGGVGDTSRRVALTLLNRRSDFYERRLTDNSWKDIQGEIDSGLTSPELMLYCQKFIASMPKWIEPPEIDVYEDDGEVVFEWFTDSYQIVNVVITASGDLYFSGLLGKNARRAGKDVVTKGIPEGLITAIERVTSVR